MRKRKTIFDDGFQNYLTEGACLVGEAGIPMLMDLRNTQIPLDIVSFKEAKRCEDKRRYVHFYLHDQEFSTVLTATKQYLNLLKQFDGAITPDCTLMIGQSKCLQQANTYMNRAVCKYRPFSACCTVKKSRLAGVLEPSCRLAEPFGKKCL